MLFWLYGLLDVDGAVADMVLAETKISIYHWIFDLLGDDSDRGHGDDGLVGICKCWWV